MRAFENLITAVLLFLFLFTAPSTAAIKSIKILSDKRSLVLFEKFGFTHTGNISVSISNVSVTPTVPLLYDPSMVGFFLVSDETMIQLMLKVQLDPGFCVVNSGFVTQILTFGDMSPSQYSINRSYTVTIPNEYALFFANCNYESPVTMNVHTELYNIDDDGTTKNYLSAGKTQLPSLYFIFSLIYFCFLGFWISLCFKNQLLVHRVHLLMCVLLATNAVNLFCVAMNKRDVNVRGSTHGWNVLYYIFQFINDALLFVVIVLIGAGWLYLKPFLQAKEKAVLMLVISLQVPANVASIVISETGPSSKEWEVWNQVFIWADGICWVAVIFPIVWSIRMLNEASKSDEKAGRNLSLFSRFFRVVFNYFLVTRFGVFALKNFVDYNYQWVSNVVDELASLVFYLVMFYMFRPVEKSEHVYFVVEDEVEHEHEDEEAANLTKG